MWFEFTWIRKRVLLYHVLPWVRLYLFLINIFSVYRVIRLWEQYYLSQPIGLFIVYHLASELHAHARNVTGDPGQVK